ncbi:MAG: hypothetical protein PHW63_03500, partial [Alphaproteobacteria bacterium]|nr:hypothetical protein [Alphaproteobacteria bacterium]
SPRWRYSSVFLCSGVSSVPINSLNHARLNNPLTPTLQVRGVYHDESVFFKDDVQERTDGPAVFHFPVSVDSNATTGEVLSVDYSPSVEIDSAFKDSPLFVAFVKVHEIACHIGQCLSCMNKPDVMRYQNLVSSGDMLNFTELSASFLEKALVHAIPEKVWGQDLLGEPFAKLMLSNDLNKKQKLDLLFDYHRKMTGHVQSIPEEAYWHLEHRKDIRPDGSAHVIGGTTVTCDDVALLHARADVRDYISRQKPRLPISPTRQRPPSPSLGTSPQ